MTGNECFRCGGRGGRKYRPLVGWKLDLLSFSMDCWCDLYVWVYVCRPGRVEVLGVTCRGSSSSSESLTMIVEQLSFSLECWSVGLLCEADVIMTSLAADGGRGVLVAILEWKVEYPDSPTSRRRVSHCFGVEYSSPSLISSLSLSFSLFVAKTRLKCLPWSNRSVPMFSWIFARVEVDSFVRFESVSPVHSAEFGMR